MVSGFAKVCWDLLAVAAKPVDPGRVPAAPLLSG